MAIQTNIIGTRSTSYAYEEYVSPAGLDLGDFKNFVAANSHLDSRDNLIFNFNFAQRDVALCLDLVTRLGKTLDYGALPGSSRTRDWWHKVNTTQNNLADTIMVLVRDSHEHHAFRLPQSIKVSLPNLSFTGSLQVIRMQGAQYKLEITFPKNIVQAKQLTPELFARIASGEPVEETELMYQQSLTETRLLQNMVYGRQGPAAATVITRSESAQRATYNELMTRSRNKIAVFLQKVKMHFGPQSLKELLEKNRFSQRRSVLSDDVLTHEEMADKIGITPTEYLRAMNHNGSDEPASPATIDKLAQYLGIDTNIVIVKANLGRFPAIDPKLYLQPNRATYLEKNRWAQWLMQMERLSRQTFQKQIDDLGEFGAHLIMAYISNPEADSAHDENLDRFLQVLTQIANDPRTLAINGMNSIQARKQAHFDPLDVLLAKLITKHDAEPFTLRQAQKMAAHLGINENVLIRIVNAYLWPDIPPEVYIFRDSVTLILKKSGEQISSVAQSRQKSPDTSQQTPQTRRTFARKNKRRLPTISTSAPNEKVEKRRGRPKLKTVNIFEFVPKLDEDKPLHETLKSWRDLFGLTTNQMALSLGLIRGTYSVIEKADRSKRPPDANSLKRLATIFSVGVEKIHRMVNRYYWPEIDPELYEFTEHTYLIPLQATAQLLLKAGQLKGRAATQNESDRVNIIYRVIKGHLEKHNDLNTSHNYSGYSGQTFFDFINTLTDGIVYHIPDQQTITALAELANLAPSFVHHTYNTMVYPKLRGAIDELMQDPFFAALVPDHIHTTLPFYLGVHDDRILKQYQDPITGKYNTQSFGFKLYAIRKLRGFTREDMDALLRVSPATLINLETDQAADYISDNNLRRIAGALGSTFETIKNWALISYPQAKKDEREYDIKNILMTALTGYNDYTDVAKSLNSFFESLGPEEERSNRDLVTQIVNYRPEEGRKATRLNGKHWAAIMAVHGHKFDTAKMWATVFDEIATIFPSIGKDEPVLELPDDSSVLDILSLSLPLLAIRRRLDSQPKLSKGELAAKLGYSAASFVSIFESRDISAPEIPRIQTLATQLRVDARLVYLNQNPWALFAIPVVDSTGQPHKGFPQISGDKDQRSKAMAGFGALVKRLNQLKSSGPALITEALSKLAPKKDASDEIEAEASDHKREDDNTDENTSKETTSFKKRQTFFTNILQSMGFDPALGQRMINNMSVLTNEEMLTIRGNAALPLDYRKLLEGYKKGELLYFLGQKIDGSIDYSYSTGWDLQKIRDFDLFAVAQAVARANQKTVSEYWNKAMNMAGSKVFQSKIKAGFTIEQIAVFSHHVKNALAIVDPDSPDKPILEEATPKNVYLKYNAEFIEQFDIKMEESNLVADSLSEVIPHRIAVPQPLPLMPAPVGISSR